MEASLHPSSTTATPLLGLPNLHYPNRYLGFSSILACGGPVPSSAPLTRVHVMALSFSSRHRERPDGAGATTPGAGGEVGEQEEADAHKTRGWREGRPHSHEQASGPCQAEDPQMLRVWEDLLLAKQPKAPPKKSHGRTTLQVPGLREDLQRLLQPRLPPQDP